MKPAFEVTYEWLEASIRSQVSLLREESFGGVVGILRGGTVPAFIASQLADAPLFFLSYDRAERAARWHTSPPPKGAKLLLVDDIAGAGFTLSDCKDFCEKSGYLLKLLTVAFDERSRLKPDFGEDLSGHTIVFPWERHRLHPGFVNDLTKNQFSPDSHYELVGVDLDGVLVPDIRDEDYRTNLEATLLRRDGLTPFQRTVWPPVDVEAALIITGRPERDRARTLEWLRQHGIRPLALHMRDEAVYSHEQSAQFKAITARHLGVTRYYESDLLQAVSMTHFSALLDVTCWNNDLGLRIAVGACRLMHHSAMSLKKEGG